jgi:hypothetical protein
VPLRPVSELGLVDITEVPARDGDLTEYRRRSTPAPKRPSQPLRSDPANDHQPEARGARSRGSKPGKPDAGRRASQRPVGASQHAAPAKSATTSERRRAQKPRNAPSTRSDQLKFAGHEARSDSKPRRTSASTATSSERARTRSKAAMDNGSGAVTRSESTRTPKRSSGTASAPRRGSTVRRQTSAGSPVKGNRPSSQAQRSLNAPGPDRAKLPSAAKVGISVLMGAGLVAGGLLFARAALQR